MAANPNFLATSTKPKGREAIKAWHRLKIIEATVDVVAAHGFAETTISRVVEHAGVSRGLVNVHFHSKKRLLLETAEHMGEIYTTIRKNALAATSSNPVDRIKTLIYTDCSPETLNVRSGGFWIALRAQVRSMPELIPLVDTRDTQLKKDLFDPISEINREGEYEHKVNMIVEGVMFMLEGLWMDYYLYYRKYDRQNAIDTIFLFLANIFPNHFDIPVKKVE